MHCDLQNDAEHNTLPLPTYLPSDLRPPRNQPADLQTPPFLPPHPCPPTVDLPQLPGPNNQY